MTDTIKNKKRQRNGIVSFLNKTFNTKIEPCIKNVPGMSDGDWNDIMGHYSMFKQKLPTIVELNQIISDEIEDDTGEENGPFQKELENGMNIEFRLQTQIEALERLLQSRQPSLPASIPSPGVAPIAQVSDIQNLTASFQKTVKLPMLQIKKFDGNPNDFQTFFESFEETIDKNKTLADVQKMGYLLSYLTGEAESCIKGLRLNNDNYAKALQMLKDRFGQPQILISHHVTKILDLENVWSISDVKALRNLYDCVETQLRNLTSLNMKPEEYGPMLIPVLMQKLPDELKLILSREKEWTFKNILDKLKIEIEAREKVKLRGDDSSMNLFAGSQENRKFECVFCGKGNHKSYQCKTITNPKSRKDILVKQKRCFLCLKQGHSVQNCRSKNTCYTCNKRHHSSICFGKSKENRDSKKDSETKNENEQKNPQQTQQQQQEAPLETQSNYASAGGTVLLQTAQATVRGTENSGQFRLLFDSGSQLSYVTPEVKKKLKLRTIGKRELTIKSFGGAKQGKVLDIVELFVETNNGPVRVEAFVSEISYPVKDQFTENAQTRYKHLKDLQLADKNDSKFVNIDILIGSNFYWSFIDGKRVVKGRLGEPVAISSNLGFILSGAVQNNDETDCLTTHVLRVSVSEDEKLNEIVERFWDFESLGIKNSEFDMKTDDLVREKFEQSIQFENGRYKVQLPEKEEHEVLADNYKQSQIRLKGIWKKFSSNKELYENYNSIINEQKSKHVIETAPDESLTGKTHYLPHRPVVDERRSTTKVRMVYDASSKEKGCVSLNEILETGPNLATKLFDTLLKFRTHNVAFVGDIEKAFLQIELCAEQRDLLRFLWFKDPEKIDFDVFENNEIIEYRLCRVIMGATPSPFLLSATLQHHAENYRELDPDFVKNLLNSLHVDDLSGGSATVQEAIEFLKKSKERFAECSMNLRKFETSDKTLEKLIIDEFGEKENPQNKTETRVLGVNWDKEKDAFYFSFEELRKKFNVTKVTKRTVLQSLASIYDPLGLINPVVIEFKLFFQKLCKMKLDWDTPLPSELLQEWQSLVNGLAELDEISFDRYFGIKDRTDLQSIELHGFSDASDRAYGACAYVCFRYSDGTCKNSLVTAKSRLKPPKKVSVPRLELLGVLTVSRLIIELDKILDLDISMIKLWTDSSAAFGWIKSDSVDSINEVFVKNRVRDIKKLLSDSIELRLVPSKQNPSDYVTKEGKSKTVIDDLWLHGPHFLTKPESEWPVLKCGDKFSDGTGCNVIETEIQVSTVDFTDLVDTTKFSDVAKLLRVIALVCKFTAKLLHRAREKIKKKNKNEKLNKRRKAEEEDTILNNNKDDQQRITEEDEQQRITEEDEQHQPLINAEDLSQARTLLILSIQKGITNERIRELDLFFDDKGILRLRGRLENAPLPYDTRHPIWLPRDNDLTELYIIDAHRKVLHNGVRETVAEMKTRFYVPRLRQKVRAFIHKCTVCRRMEGASYLYPEKSNLPTFRFADTPFSTIGIDYAGPYLVRNVYDEKDKSTYKCWISLITCLSCRAVHLDIARNYDSQACCDVMKRFIARYGVPKIVVSDNGTSFIGPEIQNFATNNDIIWKFNLKKAPWQGGVFERLIKSVKRCLSKILLKKTFTYDELLTTLIQIEKVVNNRPLCYTDEKDETLSPNNLVYGRRIGRNENEIDSENLDESVERIDQAVDHFWRMWSRDYLTELRDIRRKSKSKGKDQIKIGDVVLIHDDKLKRSQWRIGRVDELIVSKDGQVRGAGLVTTTEKGTGRLQRPVNKLYPFETDSNSNQEESEEPEIRFVKDEINIISHP